MGSRPCLSGDVEVCLAGEMFTQSGRVSRPGEWLARAEVSRRCKRAGADPPTCSSSQPGARKRLGSAIKSAR